MSSWSRPSCIYGLGAPEEYLRAMVALQVGERYDRDALIRKFIAMQYNRNDVDFSRGNFRVRGDTIEIIPVYEEYAVRIELFGDEIEALYMLHPLTGDVVQKLDSVPIFPASYVAGTDTVHRAIGTIETELGERLAELEGQGKLLEASACGCARRSTSRCCSSSGSARASRTTPTLDGRSPGEPPHTLLDFFPDDFLLVIDESHVTVPQIGAMYEGDASRKRTLVDHGFRLPSAIDNRPLRFDEFKKRIGQTVYLSATPGKYEMGIADGVVEQIIRPTGLVDPQIVVKPSKGQIDDLLEEIRVRVERDERVLVTTLTKKMAEELTDFLGEHGVRVRYLHSDVDTLRRVELLTELARACTTCGRHQPPPRGPRPARGLARRDSRRRRKGSSAAAHRSSRRSAARRGTSREVICTPTT
jgi:excinuclease ABC subunit B